MLKNRKFFRDYLNGILAGRLKKPMHPLYAREFMLNV